MTTCTNRYIYAPIEKTAIANQTQEAYGSRSQELPEYRSYLFPNEPVSVV
jgi:hypothetical protein